MPRRTTITLSALLGIAVVMIAQCVALRLWYPNHGLSGFVFLLAALLPAVVHFALLRAARMQGVHLSSGMRVVAALVLAVVPAGGCITWLLNVYGS